MVFSGLTAAWRRASWPTSRSPVRVNATTDGVVRPPSAFAMTVGSPPSITATTLLVVPRSIPTVLAMLLVPFKLNQLPDGRAAWLHLGIPRSPSSLNVLQDAC